MTPRRRKVSDEQVFAAAARVMSRVGPSQLTLTEIAAEAGVTAGALVQRFGSRRALLVTMSAGLADWTERMFEDLRGAHASPLAALRAYVLHFASMGESPGGLAHHLAYLQFDLTDPGMFQHVSAQMRATRAGLRAILADAVAGGELKRTTNVDALARAVQVTAAGALLTWAFYREGRAGRWMLADVEFVLRPYKRAR
jgi:AcrR family transcriptional regulator